MKKELHKASERGHASHGWLDTFFSFSFADYYNQKRMGFGALRVLNDDTIQPGKGFGDHPHSNMEIITIVLEGELEHRDSIGNVSVLKPGEIQVMSAGSGIVHAEYNHSDTQPLKLLQIWIQPNVKSVKPRHEEAKVNLKKNVLTPIVSGKRLKDTILIHQDATLSLGTFEKPMSTSLSIQKGNGIFLFVIEGEIEVEGENLKKRDAITLSDVDHVELRITKSSQLLAIEVPL